MFWNCQDLLLKMGTEIFQIMHPGLSNTIRTILINYGANCNSYRFLALLSKCFMICTLYLHLSFFYRCGRMECSSLHESKCADDSSEESREGPIVDVNVGRPGGRRGKGMNTRRNQSMMNYTRRGSGGSAGGSGGCPGSLEDCIAACPSSVRAFKVCTANCERRCSKK